MSESYNSIITDSLRIHRKKVKRRQIVIAISIIVVAICLITKRVKKC